MSKGAKIFLIIFVVIVVVMFGGYLIGLIFEKCVGNYNIANVCYKCSGLYWIMQVCGSGAAKQTGGFDAIYNEVASNSSRYDLSFSGNLDY